MTDVRVASGKTMAVGEVSVENKTGNSIMVRYDKERKTVLLVDCCLEEQGKQHVPHRIEVFTGNCPLCREVVNEIEAGKCAGCQLVVHNIADSAVLAKKYHVKVVPTVIIDDEVKIEGRPDIPFVCSAETYAHFRQYYPLKG